MIGEKIKNKRKELNLTQQELAESVGVTKSYISQIEKTKIIPSISKLRDIAKSLNINIADLMKSDDLDKKKFEPVLRKRGEYDILQFHGGKEEWRILPPGARNGKVVSIIGVLKPNLVEENAPITIEGHKLVYVIEGKIDFIYDDKTITISKGDTLFIDSSLPHGWVNPYNFPAKALVVLLD